VYLLVRPYNTAKLRSKKTHNVYVVELDRTVWTKDWKFRAANPQYMGVLECLYVGMTAHHPKVRFQKHLTGARSKKGHKISSYYVERFGKMLRPSLYADYNPVTRKEAIQLEKELSNELKAKGYAVWWN